MPEQKQTTILNGDLSEIRHRLTTLETQMIERWDAHDKRSDENWGQVKTQSALLFHKVDQIYREQLEEKEKKIECAREELRDSEKRRIDCMIEAKSYTNRLISLAIGIPASIVSIWGVVMLIEKMISK